MTGYGLLYRRLIYPLYHRLVGHGALDAIREMSAHEKLGRDQMIEVERRKRVALMRHAMTTVPFWNETCRSLGMNAEDAAEPESFARLPIMEKGLIRSRLKDLVSTDLTDNRLDPNSTSGSTGQPLRFYTDLRSKAFRKASTVRLRGWLGIRQGDCVAHLWGSSIDQAKAEAWRGRLHSWVTRELFLSAYKLSDDDMAGYASLIRGRRVGLIVGYPSVMEEFGRFCARKRLEFPHLKAVICSAETLYEEQKRAVEEFLGVPVFNRYGSREVGDMAQGRPGSEGLVVNSDRVYLEIVREDGTLCETGETGDVIVTDLDNFGMPFVRYRIGDRAALSSEVSGGFPVLLGVDGRSLDVVRTADGRRIGGTFWTIVLREKPGMDKFQVVQRSIEGVEIRYVRSDQEPDWDWIRARIREHCGPGLDVRFEAVDAIFPSAGGKHRVVISECSGASGGT
jgi:phenylacetate-CoA ligase